MAFFNVAVVLLLAMILSGVVIKRPGVAAALMLSVFAFEQVVQSQIRWFSNRQEAINIWFGLLAVTALAFGEFRPGKRITIGRVASIVICFMFLSVVSSAWSPTQGALDEALRLTAYSVGIGLIAPLCCRRPTDLSDLLNTTVFFGGSVCFSLLFLDHDRGGVVIQSASGEHAGNYLETGSYASVVLICALGLGVYAPRTRWNWIYYLIAVVAMAALLRSTARGALVASLIGVGVLLFIQPGSFYQRGTKRLQIVFGSLFASGVAILVFNYLFQNQVAELFFRWSEGNRAQAIEGRFDLASALLGKFLESPSHWLLGFGASASDKLIGGYCHVVPVEVLSEVGIVGFIVYCSIIYAALKSALRYVSMRQIASSGQVHFVVLLACFMIYLLLQLKQGNLHSIGGLSFFAVLLGDLPQMGGAALTQTTTPPLARFNQAGVRP